MRLAFRKPGEFRNAANIAKRTFREDVDLIKAKTYGERVSWTAIFHNFFRVLLNLFFSFLPPTKETITIMTLSSELNDSILYL